MATSPQPEMRDENVEVEMDTNANAEPGVGDEKKDETDNRQEGQDPFKKPALFSAPSLAVRRVPVPTKQKEPRRGVETLEPENSPDASADTAAGNGAVSENKTPELAPKLEKHPDAEKATAPPRTKHEVKPRGPPVKAPPAGKFKPHPPLPYTEPPWGGMVADVPYALEILKNGAIVDTVPLTGRSYFVVGRLPVCDVSLDHPSISRYHAVVQYRGRAGEEAGVQGESEDVEEAVGEEKGFYIHDLGSTHGTFVNKNKVPPKTYIRLRVGHVLKFGGSTRLFILQGPEFDEESESEFTVTELRERARKQREELEKRMMGDGSDDDDDDDDEKQEKKTEEGQGKKSSDELGCSWGMADEAAPEEDENDENPFATEFQEDQEAAYLKDPKKALQGFYDREGEELEFEYEDQNHGTWLCRIKLPVDDALGRQLVAEVTHTGKKKEAAIQCSLEACRILEARGLLRQEAVSRKRKKKNWEDEDYYDSDDDTFLDRTGTVEKKRMERMKKAGKIEERPDTYDSLVAKLTEVEKELAETQKKLGACGKESSNPSSEDSLDAFMSAVRSEASLDGVERRKLHVHAADLSKEAQRLRKLVALTRPAQMPSLQASGTSDPQKPKRSLPMFGAMKGGSKFKLKTGTIGKLPPKRAQLPEELFNMKELPPGGEEEEEDEDEEEEEEKGEEAINNNKGGESSAGAHTEPCLPSGSSSQEVTSSERPKERPSRQPPKVKGPGPKHRQDEEPTEAMDQGQQPSVKKPCDKASSNPEPAEEQAVTQASPKTKGKKIIGPSRPPVTLSRQYPEDDPDYCVWVPPAGQTGDGRTHLNDKYGY